MLHVNWGSNTTPHHHDLQVKSFVKAVCTTSATHYWVRCSRNMHMRLRPRMLVSGQSSCCEIEWDSQCCGCRNKLIYVSVCSVCMAFTSANINCVFLLQPKGKCPTCICSEKQHKCHFSFFNKLYSGEKLIQHVFAWFSVFCFACNWNK